MRGTVRSVESALPIAGVQVSARDTLGTMLAAIVSDDNGFFVLRLSDGRPFTVQARRLGLQWAGSGVIRVSARDTIDLEFRLAQVVMELEGVRVTGLAQLNEQRLAEAMQRGWRVYDPELIAAHRERAGDLQTLLRNIGAQSLAMPRNPRDCVRNARTGQCITYVLDGQVLGTENVFILPSDIYFLAVLSPAESRAQYGGRAMDGAIAIWTRAPGDRTEPPPRVRRPRSSDRPPH